MFIHFVPQEYHTGVMMYGDGFIGVLEANYSLAVAHLLAFFMGPGIWSLQVNHWLPVRIESPVCECSSSLRL